jgi:hypothetical protein
LDGFRIWGGGVFFKREQRFAVGKAVPMARVNEPEEDEECNQDETDENGQREYVHWDEASARELLVA